MAYCLAAINCARKSGRSNFVEFRDVIRIFLGMLQKKCGLSLRIYILGSTGTVSISTAHERRCLVPVVGTVLLLWFCNKLAHCIAIHAVRFKNAWTECQQAMHSCCCLHYWMCMFLDRSLTKMCSALCHLSLYGWSVAISNFPTSSLQLQSLHSFLSMSTVAVIS